MSRDILAPGGLGYIVGRMLFLGINDWSRDFSPRLPVAEVWWDY